MIVVRRVRPGEGAALRDVRLAALADAPSAFGSTYAEESLLTSEDWAARASAASSGPQRATLFAVADDAIVGLVGGYRPDLAFPRIELVSMWTHPVARRTGVGRLLIGAVLDWATAYGGQTVQLWVTRETWALRTCTWPWASLMPASTNHCRLTRAGKRCG